MAVRHIPQRTCVGCLKVKPKREMLRVVRTPGDGVEIDPTGKKPGRGAYLCRDHPGEDLAMFKPRLEYALQTKLDDATLVALTKYAQSLSQPAG